MWKTQQILDWQCDVFTPPEVSEPRFAVLFLHDEDGANLLKPALESALCTHHLSAIVPACGPCWWMDKVVSGFHPELTPLDFLMQHVADFAASDLGVGPQGLGLLGVGMGGQGALKLSYAKPSDFPVVAAVSPCIDFHHLVRDGHEVLNEVFDGVEPARQYTPILHVHPLNWPKYEFFCCDPEDYQWFDSADRLRMKLGSIGIPFDADLETSNGGDVEAYRAQMLPIALKYVAEKLDQNRRSLI